MDIVECNDVVCVCVCDDSKLTEIQWYRWTVIQMDSDTVIPMDSNNDNSSDKILTILRVYWHSNCG